jgi:general secretion pathway protein M
MITSYWNQLNDRERLTLGIGSICLIAYLIYLFAYAPLQVAVTNNNKQITEKRETFAWKQQIKTTRKKSLSSGKLLTVISTELHENTFQQFGFQLQQTSHGDIQLTYDAVPFTLFLSWLWRLNSNYDLTISQLNTEKTATPGIVKLSLMLATNPTPI